MSDTSENYKLFLPYRFHNFDRQRLSLELAERKIYPWKIHQRETSLCGIACIFYLLVQQNPNAYEKLVLDLHEFGYASYHNYIIKPHSSMLNVNPITSTSYPVGMAYADWIALASVRNMESRLRYIGKVDQVFSSINWPFMMIKLAKSFLGFKTVDLKVYSFFKSYIRDYLQPNQKLEILNDQIQKSFQEGFKVLLLIDSGMLQNKESYSFKDFVSYHWIGYEGDLEFLNQRGNQEINFDEVVKVKFNSFSWGENPKYSRTSSGISKLTFIRNYYGFLRMR